MERVTIKAKFKREIYDAAKAKGDPNAGYRVALYATRDTGQLHPSVLHSGAQEKKGRRSNKTTTYFFTACGNFIPLVFNVDITLKGIWIESKRGMQLKVEEYEVPELDSTAEIRKFLGNTVEGIGPTLAERIVDAFGKDTFKVFEESPEKLLEIKGITQAKLENILHSYHEVYDLQRLSSFLRNYDIPMRSCKKLLETKGSQIVDSMKKNPFAAYSNTGFDFEACDRIAKGQNGFNGNSGIRASCCLHDTLIRAFQEGHLYLPKEELVARTWKRLAAPGMALTRDNIQTILDTLVKKKRFVEEEGERIYMPYAYRCEKRLADKITDLLFSKSAIKSKGNQDISNAIEKALQTIPFQPADKQLEAVNMCMNSKVSVITGGPGTGKSTVIDLVLKAYKHLRPDAEIALLAPTGKAARRMTECTGEAATTIHKHIGATGEINGTGDDFYMSSSAELVVIDESSMLDLFVADALFQCLRSTCKVILVGDVHQLASVGPGNVLLNIIQSGCIPTTELNVIFRQGSQSPIVENSARMNKGIKDLIWCEDFRFITAYNMEQTKELTKRAYLDECARVGIDNVAALTPYRRNKAIAAAMLAPEIRDIVNPATPQLPSIRVFGREFRLHDRIMQLKNRGDINNGDTGTIIKVENRRPSVPDSQDKIVVDFDGQTVTIAGEDLENIDLSLSYTIHKSQGSEYKSVIIPLFNEYPERDTFLTRNLVYTAVTRAKQRVVIVGDPKTLYHAIDLERIDVRNTMLTERIQEFMRNKAKA